VNILFHCLCNCIINRKKPMIRRMLYRTHSLHPWHFLKTYWFWVSMLTQQRPKSNVIRLAWIAFPQHRVHFPASYCWIDSI